MNVCLITSLKFAVMWQDPLKLLGAMLKPCVGHRAILTNRGESLNLRDMMVVYATVNLKKDVNNKYSYTEQPPNDALRERESVSLVNHVD